MNNYYFDENGIYTGCAPAHPDTIAPDNALRVAPERQDGFWPVLNAEKTAWDLVPDHRGQRGWLRGDPVVVAELGPLPEGWTRTPPEGVCEVDDSLPATAAERRRREYISRTDGIRDLALSYRLEADACRGRGDAAGAGRATMRYNRQLAAYLEAKEAIRGEHPEEDEGGGADMDAPLFFLNRTGVFHSACCGFARGDGEWLETAELWARGEAVRPCRRCKPVIGEE